MKYPGIERLQSISTRWLQTGRNFVYPPRCALCGKESVCTGMNCGEQIEALVPVLSQTCQRCGVPVGPHLETAGGCFDCRDEKFQFQRAVALGKYEGALQESILNLKQNHGASLGGGLANLLFFRNQEFFDQLGPELIVPVPLHWTSRLRRTHNPASIIAEALSHRLQAKYSGNILAKRKKTPPQTSLSPQNRRTNLRDAFRVRRPGLVKDLRILLVDDVMTTGSTANAAARALLQAGASEINVAVIARAPRI